MRDECIPLVRRFPDVFAGHDAVITPPPSCAAVVSQHHGTVARDAGDAGLERAVAEVVPHVFEPTESRIDVPRIRDVGAVFPHAVGMTAVDNTGLIADLRARSAGVRSNQPYRSETRHKPGQARPSWSRLETGSTPGGIGRREACTTAIV